MFTTQLFSNTLRDGSKIIIIIYKNIEKTINNKNIKINK